MSSSEPGKARASQGIQSVEIGGQLLGVLADAATALALKEIAARAGMTASKAHKYMVSFSRLGLTRQDPVSGHYDLGPLALKMGLAALNRRDVVRLATVSAIEFNQRHDITVMVTIWTPRGPLVIALYNSSKLVIGNVGVGSVLPVLRSASGRVFLAYLPSQTTQSLVSQELSDGGSARRSGFSLHAPADVDVLVTRVRERGLGWTHDDLVVGLNAVAAPVFDNQGQIVASLTLLDDTEAVDFNSPASLAGELKVHALQVSRSLGFWLEGPSATLAAWLQGDRLAPPPAVLNPARGPSLAGTSRARGKQGPGQNGSADSPIRPK